MGLSPGQHSPYNSMYGNDNPYWPTSVQRSARRPDMNGTYGMIPSMNYPDQSHNLPHIHESGTRASNSNDLRVMYPTLAA